MKSQPVEFLPSVAYDLKYAQEFYSSWLDHGADKFLGRFREAVAWIEWNPEQFPKKYRHFRRVIVRRTYFGINFSIEPGMTVVTAVLDMRQKPRTVRAFLKLRRSA